VFVFVVMVDVEVGYNPIMHKIQLQKLVFHVFSSFFDGSHAQTSTSITKTNKLLRFY
jgi:hypothetical protein